MESYYIIFIVIYFYLSARFAAQGMFKFATVYNLNIF